MGCTSTNFQRITENEGVPQKTVLTNEEKWELLLNQQDENIFLNNHSIKICTLTKASDPTKKIMQFLCSRCFSENFTKFPTYPNLMPLVVVIKAQRTHAPSTKFPLNPTGSDARWETFLT
ncbi:hypothetical protein JTE90_021423 [Oedothorax gibbosus]|uniref:Uncharacterized protein n=1 Tax=Oedothorax gibbosus TaxID=931172 RepID=A0AAV6VFW5_9ARAC|nr:hypothetical protein JTE90_021423 [Oedothorax gibbosus]